MNDIKDEEVENLVKSKLRYLMLENGIKGITELSEKTGISRITLTDFADNKSKMISFKVLSKLKVFFDLNSISELMEYENV